MFLSVLRFLREATIGRVLPRIPRILPVDETGAVGIHNLPNFNPKMALERSEEEKRKEEIGERN